MKEIKGNINRDRYKVLERFIAKYQYQYTVQMGKKSSNIPKG